MVPNTRATLAEARRRLAGLSEDLAARDHALATLRVSEARYRHLFMDSPAALWVEDFAVVRAYLDDLCASGCHDLAAHFAAYPEEVTRCAGLVQVLDVNPATLTLYGARSVDEFYEGLPRIFVPESYPGFARLLVALGKGLCSHRDEVINCTLKGERLHLRMTARLPDRDAPEQIAYLSFVDITDLVRTQEALRASESRRREAERLEAIGQLAGGVAHEFNNLLTVIGGYADLLASMIGPEKPGAFELGEIVAANDRAAQLTRELLAFGRRQMLQLSPIDLNRLVVDVAGDIERELGRGHRLILSLSERVPVARADRDPLKHVLLTLANRARAAFVGAGTLQLTTDIVVAPEGGSGELGPGVYCRIAMHDSAAALSPDEIHHLFEPFYSNGSIVEHSGLRLSSAYGTVKQLGGGITVETTPPQGNTLTVWLPAVVAPTHGATVDAMKRIAEQTVLLIEADDGVRRLVERIVADMGHGVLWAPNMATAERLCAAHHAQIAVAIVDLDLPDAAEQLLERLEVHCGDARIVLMSSYPTEIRLIAESTERAIEAIAKPFSPQRLTACLQVLLETRA